MKLYKTSKGAGIACIILSLLFIALGIVLLLNPDGEDVLVTCVMLFIFGAVVLGVGLVTTIMPTKKVTLVDDKLVFERFKYEPKNSVFADEANRSLTIPTSEIVDLQVQGQSKSSSFWAAFLGGAIGAAIAGNKNPDKLIIKTNDSQVVVFIPQVAGNKIKKNIKLEPAQPATEQNLDTIETIKPLEEEE
ncbi:MAG: hypothetical protein K2O22_03290 [Anaeroplasmataceae bacterium]|nr:hypothetical protein [Anaeroplasmataceae bacterium]